MKTLILVVLALSLAACGKNNGSHASGLNASYVAPPGVTVTQTVACTTSQDPDSYGGGAYSVFWTKKTYSDGTIQVTCGINFGDVKDVYCLDTTHLSFWVHTPAAVGYVIHNLTLPIWFANCVTN